MSYFMTDVEGDGPMPPDYSMVSIGLVIVRGNLSESFYAKLRPISEHFIPEALAVSGFNRDQHLGFDDPKVVVPKLAQWIKEKSVGKPMFISDNNGYDWLWTNYYLWKFAGENPFGHSSTNLGSLYKGLVKDAFKNFKHLRVTTHTHNPVDDARGNAEALLKMKEMGLAIRLD